ARRPPGTRGTDTHPGYSGRRPTLIPQQDARLRRPPEARAVTLLPSKGSIISTGKAASHVKKVQCGHLTCCDVPSYYSLRSSAYATSAIGWALAYSDAAVSPFLKKR